MTDTQFWDDRYRSGRAPWEFNGVPAEARRFIRDRPPGRVLIPGCGSSHDVAAFCRAGWQVTGIELSPAAIEIARATVGVHAGAIRLGDFFSAPLPADFDVLYERAFICAIEPSWWSNYVARVHHLLVPDGLLAGYFYYGGDPEPPPYSLTPASAARLFGGRFRLEVDRPVTDSLPVYAGGERWQEWRKLG